MGVEGHGDLLFNPDRDHPIEVANKIEHMGTLEIRDGSVRFLTPDAYSKNVLIQNGGRLIVEGPQTFDRITTPAASTSCCSPRGNVEVLARSSLNQQHH